MEQASDNFPDQRLPRCRVKGLEFRVQGLGFRVRVSVRRRGGQVSGCRP